MKLSEIATRISAHLQAMEADPSINKISDGLSLYYDAFAYASGNRVFVKYINYQKASSLTRERAEEYLARLDSGERCKHHRPMK